MRRILLLVISVILVGGIVWWWNRGSQSIKTPASSIPSSPVKNLVKLTSPAFEADGAIPAIYSCTGDNTNPPLNLGSVPPAVKFFAVTLEDLDPSANGFDHWVQWDIPAISKTISEKNTAGVTGQNSKGEDGYTGPCPTAGEHTYKFTVYGYTKPLSLGVGATKKQLLDALKGRALVSAELAGKYSATK